MQFPVLEGVEKQDYANYRHMMFTLPIALDAVNVVETGLGNGHSTRIFLESLAQLSGIRWLHTFEIIPIEEVVSDIRELIIRSYDENNLRWTLHVGDSIASMSQGYMFFGNNPIDLLYLDSAHDYETVFKELKAFAPYLSLKAWILLDDVYIDDHTTEVYRAAQDWTQVANDEVKEQNKNILHNRKIIKDYWLDTPLRKYWKSMLFTEQRGFGKENIKTNGKMILYRC